MGYPIHGKVSRIAKNSVAISGEIEFSLNVNLELAGITGKGDNWKSWLPGLAEADGEMKFNLDPSNTEQKAILDNIVAATPGTTLTDVVFRLENSGDYFSGNLIITGFTVSSPVGDRVTGSFPFKFTGALSATIA